MFTRTSVGLESSGNDFHAREIEKMSFRENALPQKQTVRPGCRRLCKK